ncbi:MAG: hypothetical protein GX621_00355 [Pirellulaceae bacterium]|nr:hypothetical protein [Pirellulaceae bacterium]
MTSKLTVPAVVLIVCGGALLLAAVLWARFKNPRDYWNETQARTMAHAGSVHHAAACDLSETEDEQRKATLLAAFEQSREKYQQEQAAFAQARERFERPLRLMRWSGTICLVLGILVYWLTRGG